MLGGAPATQGVEVLTEPGLEELRSRYRNAAPFPHLVFDGLLRTDVAGRLAREFPPHSEASIAWVHWNQRKFGESDTAKLLVGVRRAIAALESPPFLRWLSFVSGIEGLLPDPSLHGAGVHHLPRGGFVNVHTDFSVHPRRSLWQRRLSLLLFVNKSWDASYGGEFELWDASVRRCERRVTPAFNRAVLFECSPLGWHGSPNRVRSPAETSRRTLAIYYYTRESRALQARSTRFRARPGDGAAAKLAVRVDNTLLALHGSLRRRLGLRDERMGRWLGRAFGQALRLPATPSNASPTEGFEVDKG